MENWELMNSQLISSWTQWDPWEANLANFSPPTLITTALLTINKYLRASFIGSSYLGLGRRRGREGGGEGGGEGEEKEEEKEGEKGHCCSNYSRRRGQVCKPSLAAATANQVDNRK